MKNPFLQSIGISIITLGTIIVFSNFVSAGNFKVSPVKVFFEPYQRTATISVRNMVDEKANIQIKVVKWDQDDLGKDVYEDTNDIIVFPQIVSIESNDEQILRLGYQANEPPTDEKTYRVFIEELPVVKPGEKALKFNLRINIPVFVAPLQEEKMSAIEEIKLSKAALTIRVKNSGNAHILIRKFVVKGLDNDGKDVFSKEINGWYTLAGKERVYSVQLNKEDCLQSTSIQIVAKMSKSSMHSMLNNFDKVQCLVNEPNDLSTEEDKQHVQ